MNVIMTNYSEVTYPGGVHKTIREIARHLSKKGHKIVIIQGNPLKLPNKEVHDGYAILRISSRLGDYLYGLAPEIWIYMKKHYKELNPDIIHVHGYHTLFSPGMIYAIKKYYPSTPLVFSPHFGIYSHNTLLGKIFWKPYTRIIGKWLVDNVDVIILASKFEQETFKKEFPEVPDSKIIVIPHGVDKIKTKKEKLNGKDTITLLYGGYLLEIKGVQYIILALDDLINRRGISNIKLKIIGNGPYESNLKDLVNKLGISEFVEFTPFMPHELFLNEIEKADVFLYLSKAENYGITVAEVLALGTPVIVTKRTALKEFLNEPGCFGVDYPPDPREVAELILKIVSSKVKVGLFSRKIRTWDEVVEEYEKVYIKLVGGHL